MINKAELKTRAERKAAKPTGRLLFNKTGMSFTLDPEIEGGERRIFKVGTAIMPLNAQEESDLLGYPGVVYADTIMPAKESDAQLQAKIKELEKRNAELTEEGSKLKESMAAGVGGGGRKK